jgi:hypothetical protein
VNNKFKNMSQNGKKTKLNVEAINEILVADTDSESGAEASDIENEFEAFEDEKTRTSLSTTRRATGCDKWQSITNLGTASRKEHQCPPFSWFSKRSEKQ